jgi:hypothetical protein
MFQEYFQADAVLVGIATYCALVLKDIRDMMRKKIKDDWEKQFKG